MAPLMTATEVAAHFGCSVRTVNRMAQLRVLPALKRGKHWRFAESAVLAYEAAHTTAPKLEPTPSGSVVTIRPSYQPGDMDGELPPRWWESTAINAASPAAQRGGSTTKRKVSSVSR